MIVDMPEKELSILEAKETFIDIRRTTPQMISFVPLERCDPFELESVKIQFSKLKMEESDDWGM